MTRDDFLANLEQELRLTGAAFDRATLEAFVADAWPLILDRPDVSFWAREYLDAGHATRTTRTLSTCVGRFP